MTINISFGGANIKRPGAYSVVDTEGMFPISSGGFKVLAYMGVPATGSTLPAGQVSYFNSPINAKKQIAACELLDLMNTSWDHGADLIAVSPVASTAADADWQAAIDLLATEDVDGLLITGTAAAMQAKIDAHCALMSSVKNRRERRGFYGHALGLTVAEIVALQAALSNERAMIATPCVYNFDDTGTKVLKASNYLAAAYAGIWASNPSQEPITYKYVNFPGLETVYTGDDIEALLAGHIAPTEYVRGKGYRIVQGVTCSGSDDLSTQELSISTIKDEIGQTLRDYFEGKYVGKAAVAGIQTTVYNDYISYLENFVKQGLISDYDKSTVQVVQNGTEFDLQAVMKPTLPINNFLFTSHLNLK